MHAACSPETVLRRYFAPMPDLSPRLAARLLSPTGGFSLVAERGSELAGIVTVAPDADGVGDVGVLVADAWQRQGIGTSLLCAAVAEAEGFTDLLLTAHPANRAVLPTVHAAGLRAHVSRVDGLVEIAVPLRAADRRSAPGTRLHSAGSSAKNWA